MDRLLAVEFRPERALGASTNERGEGCAGPSQQQRRPPHHGCPLPSAVATLRLRPRMIAQKTRYALRSLLFLAEEQGGAPVQLSRIAETQRVPPKYLELIMLDLKKAGLVKSARGPKGGYRLSRPPEQISFGEIVRSMEGPIALVSCASVNFYAPCGDCQDEATCAIRRAFTIMRDQSTAVLDSISLAQGAEWEERIAGVSNGADGH